MQPLKPANPNPQRTQASGRPAPRVQPQRSGPFHAELVVTGRELLRGQVAEDSARSIAERISSRGGLVHRITVVDDNVRAIAAVVREALDRNPNLVVTCGGLGPAPDDVTLQGVGEALGLPLTMNAAARSLVEAAYQRMAAAREVRSAGLNLVREKMCRIPVGGTPLLNETGLPPGVVCRLAGGAAVVCLPGTPGEAARVFEEALPELREILPRSHTARREVEAPSPDESALRDLLVRLTEEYPGIWVSSRPVRPDRGKPVLLVTLEATAPSEEAANGEADAALRRLLALASGSR